MTTGLTCPHCGSTKEFRLLEDIVCWREIVGINDNGQLEVNGLYKSGEGYDDGSGQYRIECRECLGEFDLPLADDNNVVEIEFV